MVLIAQKLLVKGSAPNEAAAVDLGRLGCEETKHTVEWGLGVTAGTVLVEAAPRTTYTGKWELVGSIVFAGSGTAPGAGPAPKVQSFNATGTYAAIRHRCSDQDPILGGTVTSRIDGSGEW